MPEPHIELTTSADDALGDRHGLLHHDIGAGAGRRALAETIAQLDLAAHADAIAVDAYQPGDRGESGLDDYDARPWTEPVGEGGIDVDMMLRPRFYGERHGLEEADADPHAEPADVGPAMEFELNLDDEVEPSLSARARGEDEDNVYELGAYDLAEDLSAFTPAVRRQLPWQPPDSREAKVIAGSSDALDAPARPAPSAERLIGSLMSGSAIDYLTPVAAAPAFDDELDWFAGIAAPPSPGQASTGSDPFVHGAPQSADAMSADVPSPIDSPPATREAASDETLSPPFAAVASGPLLPATSQTGGLIPVGRHTGLDATAPEPLPFASLIRHPTAGAPPPPERMATPLSVAPSLTARPAITIRSLAAPAVAPPGPPLGPPPRFAAPGMMPPTAPAPPPAAPLTVAVAACAVPVRVKSGPPPGYVPASNAGRRPAGVNGDALPDARTPPFSMGMAAGAPRPFPRKLAVAALVLATVIIVAGRVALPGAPAGGARNPAAATVPIDEAAAAALRGAPRAGAGTGQVVVNTNPSGASISLDGQPVGKSPLTLTAVAAGRHVLTLASPSGVVERTVQVVPGVSVTLDVPIFSGWIAVFAPFVINVAEAGRPLGTTLQGHIMAAPGRHRLTLSNAELEFTAERDVEVKAGDVTSVHLDPKGQANINAIPWAEVWSDGRKIGDTPIANQRMPLGTQVFIFRHPQLGERRVTATIRGRQPTAVTVEFARQER